MKDINLLIEKFKMNTAGGHSETAFQDDHQRYRQVLLR